jgi:tetratricopeptide (TPR) repeat protein
MFDDSPMTTPSRRWVCLPTLWPLQARRALEKRQHDLDFRKTVGQTELRHSFLSGERPEAGDRSVSSTERYVAAGANAADNGLAGLREQSVALYQARRFGDAERACQQILAREPASFEALLMLGALATQNGRPAEAEGHFRRAIGVNAAVPHAHNNLGIVLTDLGRSLEALASFDQAIALWPEFADAHCNRAAALHLLGRFDECVRSYDAALAADPGLVRAHRDRGFALYQLGRNAEALQSYDRAIALEPKLALSHSRRGEVLLELRRPQEALVSCDRAIVLDPTLGIAHLTRAAALRQYARFAEALAACDRALALQHDSAAAHTGRGVSLFELGRHEEALRHLRRATALDPAYVHAHWHAGLCLRRMDRREEALVAWDRTQALQPNSAATLVNRGQVLYELGRFAEAVRDYRAAMALAPDSVEARWNASWCLLKLGQFAQGWELFEWRHRLPTPSPPRELGRPLWTGDAPLAGRTLLVHAEQGLGDVIQFCRYVEHAAARGASVILEAPEPLCGLLKSLDGVARLVTRGEVLPEFDYHCPLMSLPRAFRTDLATIPARVPYLSAESKKVCEWGQRLGARRRPRVGLVWSSAVRPEQPQLWSYARRNIPLAALIALRGVEVDFYSLQKGEPAESQLSQAIAHRWQGPRILDCAPELRDFTDTAALIENLDLIVSVDTATAHLAGALARPAWILLCSDACWRWFLDRDDSPWYPTARLYRQERPGDWDGVMRRVAADLGQFTAGTR